MRLATHVRALPGRRLRGQGLVEYGLIIALVATLAVVGLMLLGGAVPNPLVEFSTSI